MGDEAAAQLERRLSQESSDRDAAQLSLQRLQTAVDFHRSRLVALLQRPTSVEGGDSIVDIGQLERAREIVAELQAEVQGTGGDSTLLPSPQVNASLSSSSPTRSGSYEAVRHALRETLRQCEVLNVEMVQQADANESLVDALGLIKDANRQLLEQIRAQTAEISALSRQRVADEERLEGLARQHERDREAARQASQQQVIAVRETITTQQGEVRRRLADGLASARARGAELQETVGGLRRGLEDSRREAENFAASLQQRLRQLERELPERLLEPPQQHSKWKQALEGAISDLKTTLQSEHECRREENLEWSLKYSALIVEKEGLELRTGREISSLTTKMQILEKRRTEDVRGWPEERSRLEQSLRALQEQGTANQVLLERLERDIVAAESEIAAARTDTDGIEEALVELRHQAREADDALAAAVAGNDHLREQLDEQRRRFQAKNEAEALEGRAALERRLEAARTSAERRLASAAAQLQGMEEDIRAKDEEVTTLKAKTEALLAERSSLEKEEVSWRSKAEAADLALEAIEKELQEAKLAFEGDRLRAQAAIERLAEQTSELEEEVDGASRKLQQRRRAVLAQQAQGSARQVAAEGLLREAQEQLADCRARLREATDARARMVEEASLAQARVREREAQLEREVERKAVALQSERARLEGVLAAERRAREQVSAELDRERGQSAGSLRRAQEESRSKLAGAQRERALLEEACRTDLEQGKEYLAQQNRRIEVLEHELARARTMLKDSEANLAWVSEETDRAERSGLTAQSSLDDEVLGSTLPIDAPRHAEANRWRSGEDRRSLHSDLGDGGVQGARVRAASAPRIVASPPFEGGFGAWSPPFRRGP